MSNAFTRLAHLFCAVSIILGLLWAQTPTAYADSSSDSILASTDDPWLISQSSTADTLTSVANKTAEVSYNESDGSITVSTHSSVYQDGTTTTKITGGSRSSSTVETTVYDGSGKARYSYTVSNDSGADSGTLGSVTKGSQTVTTIEIGGSSAVSSNVATSSTAYYTMGWTVDVTDSSGNVVGRVTIPRGNLGYNNATNAMDYTYETQSDGTRVEQISMNLDYLYQYGSDEIRAAIDSGTFKLEANPIISVTTTRNDGEAFEDKYKEGAFIFVTDANGNIVTDANGNPLTQINPDANSKLKAMLAAAGITDAALTLDQAVALLEAFGISTNKIGSAFNKYYEENIEGLIDELNSEFPFLSAEEIYALLLEWGVTEDPEEENTDPTVDPNDPDGNPNTEFIYQVWTGGSSGVGTAKIEYYNDSREYNDADGNHVGFADAFDTDANGEGIIIPSSEKYLTGITAQTYTGTVGISIEKESHDFVYNKFTYTYTQLIFAYHEGYATDEDGNTVMDSSGNPVEDNYWYCRASKSWDCGYGKAYDSGFNGKTTRTANSIYISDLDLYDFGSAETSNETFTTGSQTFLGTDTHVLDDINPEENSSGDPIGPVDAGGLEEYGYTDIHSSEKGNARPTYLVDLVGTTTITSNANPSSATADDDSTVYMSSFDPGIHISWGSWEHEDVVDLGSFTDILYDAQDGSSTAQFTTSPHSGAAQSAANAKVNDWVGDGKTKSTNLTTLYYATYTTDGLIVGYDSNAVLAQESGDVVFTDAESWSSSDSWPTVATSNGGTVHVPSYLLSFVNATISNMNSFILQVPDTETYETSPAFGGNIGQQQEIDAEQANGEYPTSYSGATYRHILAYSGSTTVSASGNLKGVYSENDPIIVQTPVVSPVSIYDDPDSDLSTGVAGSGSSTTPDAAGYEPIQTGAGSQSGRLTQLAYQGAESGRNDDLVQLRLDESYWFKFDPYEHLSTQGYADWTTGTPFDNTWSEDDIKFDKYVKAKYVHFPFAVCVYEKDNTLPTYYPLVTDEDDPNYWIKIYDQDDDSTSSNIIWTRFYIPSWAIEGSYPDTSGIRYKVESINVVNGDGEHDTYNDNGDLSDATSDDHELYIATYDFGVQLSGWIYNFQIVGINNRDLYDQNLTETFSSEWHDLYYSFCWNYEEKKAGTLNRLGGDDRYTDESVYVRYTKSGEIAHTGDSVSNYTLSRSLSSEVGWVNKNTVVLDNTKSHKYEDAGTAPKGTEFAFSVQTISNLWNDGDWIEITPSFWWQSDDGTSLSQEDGLYVYYNDNTGSSENLYIPYGSSRDNSLVKTVSLSNMMFDGSYQEEDLEATVLHPVYNESTASFSNTNSVANVDNLVSQYKARKNECYTLSKIALSSNLRIYTGDVSELKANITVDRDSDEVKSLTDMYIFSNSADLDAVETCVQPSMQTWYGSYILPSELFVSTMSPDELNAYITEHGSITDDDENVWLQGGYLIVHFDIIAHNSEDSKKDLAYSAGNSGAQNMWQAQKQDLTAEVGSTVSDSSSGHYGHRIISVNYGDILVIDMEESIDDWFDANIWSIQ